MDKSEMIIKKRILLSVRFGSDRIGLIVCVCVCSNFFNDLIFAIVFCNLQQKSTFPSLTVWIRGFVDAVKCAHFFFSSTVDFSFWLFINHLICFGNDYTKCRCVIGTSNRKQFSGNQHFLFACVVSDWMGLWFGLVRFERRKLIFDFYFLFFSVGNEHYSAQMTVI